MKRRRKSGITDEKFAYAIIILAFGALAGFAVVDEISAYVEERDIVRERILAEDRRKGFHCLTGWNGSHAGLIRHFKRNLLNDPASFEHIETRITPEFNGWHRLLMDFRTRNTYGGMVRGTLTASVNTVTCAATITGLSH